MQQFITSSETNALLERVLQTVHSLNEVRTALFGKKSEATATQDASPEAEPMERANRISEIRELGGGPSSPVLTIKLDDLVRAGMEARERRNQHFRPQRPVNKQRPKAQKGFQSLRSLKQVEIVYRRTHRMAS